MLSEPTRLPYTRPPESDESLRGYLLGLAIDNGYPSLASLMEISGSPKSRPTTFDAYDLAPLARLVAQPQEVLQSLTYPPTAKASRVFLNQTIPAFLFDLEKLHGFRMKTEDMDTIINRCIGIAKKLAGN